MKDAVKILQIEAIADLKQTVRNHEQENDEKDRKIEQMKKESEESTLVKKLNGQTTLVNYLMNVISKSQQVFEAKKDLIENHAEEIKRLQTKLGECHKRHNANLKIIYDSHQTILTQKDSMARLEKMIELSKMCQNLRKTNRRVNATQLPG